MEVYNLKQMWGALALRGAALILFGLAAVFWPSLTLVTLVYLFGAYVVLTGLVNEIVGLTNFGNAGRSFWGRVLQMLLGAAEIGLGIYLLRHPHVTFATFILLAGLTLLIRGVVEIFTGIFGDDSGSFKALIITGGVLSVVIGIIVLAQPVSSGIAFVWLLGLYALITGPMLVAMAFEAKNAVVVVDLPAKARVAR